MKIEATIQTKGTLQGTIQTKGCLAANMTIPKTTKGENDYEKLINLPRIEEVTLIGNKTFDELGMSECTNQEIIDLFK